MLTAQEEAERLWNAVELAAGILPKQGSIALGVIPADVLAALAKLAGASVEGTLYLGESWHPAPYVIEGLKCEVKGITIYAQSPQRPATPGDAALGGCRIDHQKVSPEEAAKALGVGQ